MVPTTVSAAAPVRRYDRRSTVPVALGIPPYRTDGELAVRGGCWPRPRSGSGAARRRPPGVGGGDRRGGGPRRRGLGDRHDRTGHGHEGRGRRGARAWRCRRCPPTSSGASVARGSRRRGSSAAASCSSSRRSILLVAPPAVEQASDFSDELPATVRDLYSWPIVGDRLEEADAAGEVEQAIDDLPARIDDQTLAEFGERLLGGAFSTRRGGDRRHRGDGRRRGDRAPRPSGGATVPPGPRRRAGPDRLPLLRQLLRGLAARRRAQRPVRPHRRAAARRAARAHRRHLGRRSPTSSRRSGASWAARSSCCSPSPRAPPRP